MKNICLLLLFQATFFFISASISGQIYCKVLVPALSGNYTGSCKNGLAHGKGTAQGMDRYTGSFRTGLPHGKEKYEWDTGEIYEGEFKQGLMHGIGKMTFKWGDHDSVLYGKWSQDRFIEPLFDPPDVITKIHIKGYFFKQLGEGSTVVLSFPEMDQSGTENILITVNNGTRVKCGKEICYNLVHFPFYCKIIILYEDPSRLIKWDCILEFVIKYPGYWMVQVYI